MNEQQQLIHLFDAIYHHYGCDYRHYAEDSALRRVLKRMRLAHIDTIPSFERAILDNVHILDDLLRDLSINVTEMFRDPAFYSALNTTVLGELARYDHVKIWHAGCSTGEEVYSMAILLSEHDLYDRCQIFGTDYNKTVLAQAKAGIFPLSCMKTYTRNYIASGGRASFADYYLARYEGAMMNSALKRHLKFAYHDLSREGPITEVQMVVCRNVLIYFNRELQTNVLETFYNSLCYNGFLCLGSAESLQVYPIIDRFEVIDQAQRIYQKKR